MPGKNVRDPPEPPKRAPEPASGSVRVSVSVPILVVTIFSLSPALVTHTVLHPSPFWALVLALAIWRAPVVRLSVELSQSRALEGLRKLACSDWAASLRRESLRKLRYNARKWVKLTRREDDAHQASGPEEVEGSQPKKRRQLRFNRKRPEDEP